MKLDAWSTIATAAVFLYGLCLLEKAIMTEWKQSEISLKAKPRGCHLVTNEVGRFPALPQPCPVVVQTSIVSSLHNVCTGDEAIGRHAEQV